MYVPHLLYSFVCGYLGCFRISDAVNSTAGASGKETDCRCRRCKRRRFSPWVGRMPWRRKRQPTLVFLPGKSHGQKSLAGYGPQGHKESEMTEATQHSEHWGACVFLNYSLWGKGTLLHYWWLEKEIAAHSSILAWKTPWTEKPGGLQSIGL